MSARVGAADAVKRSLAADGIQVIGKVTDEFADVITPDAVRFVARLQRRFNSTRLSLLQRRVGQQLLADAGRPLSFPKACTLLVAHCSIAHTHNYTVHYCTVSFVLLVPAGQLFIVAWFFLFASFSYNTLISAAIIFLFRPNSFEKICKYYLIKIRTLRVLFAKNASAYLVAS